MILNSTLLINFLLSCLFVCKTILQTSWTSLQFLAPSRWAIKAQNTLPESVNLLKGCTGRKNQQRLLENYSLQVLKKVVCHLYTHVKPWYTGWKASRKQKSKSGLIAIQLHCLKGGFNFWKLKTDWYTACIHWYTETLYLK